MAELLYSCEFGQFELFYKLRWELFSYANDADFGIYEIEDAKIKLAGLK